MKVIKIFALLVLSACFCAGCHREESGVTEEYIPHEERGLEEVDGHDKSTIEENTIEVEVIKPTP